MKWPLDDINRKRYETNLRDLQFIPKGMLILVTLVVVPVYGIIEHKNPGSTEATFAVKKACMQNSKLCKFKLALAEVLTRANALQRKRGRPSTSLQPQLELKKKKYPFSQVPAHEIRTDNLNHLPVVNGERQRRKYPECKGKPQISCPLRQDGRVITMYNTSTDAIQTPYFKCIWSQFISSKDIASNICHHQGYSYNVHPVGLSLVI
nr:unnamed protein product [Callosobruchus chinensis]